MLGRRSLQHEPVLMTGYRMYSWRRGSWNGLRRPRTARSNHEPEEEGHIISSNHELSSKPSSPCSKTVTTRSCERLMKRRLRRACVHTACIRGSSHQRHPRLLGHKLRDGRSWVSRKHTKFWIVRRCVLSYTFRTHFSPFRSDFCAFVWTLRSDVYARPDEWDRSSDGGSRVACLPRIVLPSCGSPHTRRFCRGPRTNHKCVTRSAP
ncbi:hypothetical protein C8R45DRAFT_300292 [Mycena sanguinolenta]|nr:hypothetical protein C8R45DRAFT_300292 [Mycena sanguinolenta]